MSSFSLTTSPHSPRQGRSDPGRIAPFLTNVVAHHGQLTLVPPQNMGRIRRGEKKTLERARTERRRDAEEPRFNTAAPASPRSASRRVHNPERNPRPTPAAPSRFSRDTMIPDYPPPSFQEAMMTPPFIPPPPPAETQELAAPVPSDEDRSSVQEPLPEIEVLASTTSSPSASPSTDIANPPPAPPQPLTLRMEITPDADHESPQSHGSSASSGSDNGSEDSSIELINLDTDGYDQEQRLRGPLRCRANRIHRRQHCKEPHGIHTPRQVSHLSIDVDDLHDRCTRCGSHRPSDCDGPESPTDHSHTSSSMSSHSPPGSPKASKWRRLFVPAGGHNVEPLPMSPTVSSPRSPRFGFLPSALASTLTLSAPSQPSPSKPFSNPVQHSQRKEPSVMRRIFSPKGKEREAHGIPEHRNPRDSVDWEFIDNKELSSLEEGEDEDEIHQQHENPPAERGVPKASTNTLRLQSTATITQGGRSEETSSPTQARQNTLDHRAFLHRPVRHSPLSLNPFPMFSANSSVVSLPLATTAHERLQPMHVSPNSTNNTEDPGQMGSSSLARRQTLSVSHASPSVVWLPLITGDDGTVTVAGSPVVSTIPSSLSGLSPRTPPRLGQEGVTSHSRSPPTPSSAAYSSGRPSHLLPSPLAFSFTPDHSAEELSPSPTFTDSPGQDSPQEAPEFRSIPPLRSPASASTLGSTNSNDPPSSPTTPTRHYSGRPLPQLPGPPHPFEGPGRTPLFRPAFLPGQVVSGPYPQVSDLDVFAARVIEDDTDGRHYEDLLRIAELAGPAVSPDKNGDDGLTLPPSGRVKLKRRRVTKDGRVKLKLTLMDAVVDKCGICLSQFKEAEVACLGTACPHAFHEYCLKRWIATRRNCPLCRADI